MFFCAERFGWTVEEFNRTSLSDILTLYDIALELNRKTEESGSEGINVEGGLALLKSLKEKYGKKKGNN